MNEEREERKRPRGGVIKTGEGVAIIMEFK